MAFFVKTCVTQFPDVLIDSEVFRPLLDVFFLYESHSVYQRVILDIIIEVFEGDNTSVASYLLKDCDLLTKITETFLRLKATKASSLRAHVATAAEVITNALYRELIADHLPPESSSWFALDASGQKKKSRLFESFFSKNYDQKSLWLSFVADHLAPATIRRTHDLDDGTDGPTAEASLPVLLPPSVFP